MSLLDLGRAAAALRDPQRRTVPIADAHHWVGTRETVLWYRTEAEQLFRDMGSQGVPAWDRQSS